MQRTSRGIPCALGGALGSTLGREAGKLQAGPPQQHFEGMLSRVSAPAKCASMGPRDLQELDQEAEPAPAPGAQGILRKYTESMQV